MRYFCSQFLLGLVFIAPTLAVAQNLQTLGGGSGTVTIRTIPSRPGPNQNVSIILESFATNLDRATITWLLNGKIQTDKVGQKTFSFKTGKAGSVSDILIIIKTPEGAVTQESLSIHPASVDLIAEAESYTPPFYRGKALYPFQGTVKVVALPNIVTSSGSTLNPKNLLYSWKVDGHPATSVSGYGKSFITFTGTIPLKPAVISVEVASLDQTYVAGNSITLTPVQPRVVFYEENPLVGTLYNKSLASSLFLKNEEIKVVAIPYFSETSEREGGKLNYEWRINNNIIPGSSNKSGLAFRQEKGVSGMAAVSLQVSNPAKIFQFANANLSLFFGTDGN